MEPVRTCVGCGGKASRRDLVRLRIEGERVVIDRDGKGGGRGAWLHAGPSCLEQAIRRRALARAFRRKGASIDASALNGGLTGNARKD
ncbi:MAG TPA: DUF448 domain-containing protein [Anaeromyxobacter sp.]